MSNHWWTQLSRIPLKSWQLRSGSRILFLLWDHRVCNCVYMSLPVQFNGLQFLLWSLKWCSVTFRLCEEGIIPTPPVLSISSSLIWSLWLLIVQACTIHFYTECGTVTWWFWNKSHWTTNMSFPKCVVVHMFLSKVSKFQCNLNTQFTY